MKKAELEIVLFDARDIIATSGEGEFIPSGIGVIWLTPESISKYNELNKDDLYDIYLMENVKQPYRLDGSTVHS